MSWGLTYLAYPKLKIVHCARRVHSNIDPLSCLERRIPFFDQPASNDPNINLSQEKDINFYRRMKQKFNIWASSLIARMNHHQPTTIEINLPNKHLLTSVTYFTATKMEMFLHVNPMDVQTIIKGYEEDAHFSTIIHSFPSEPPFTFKNYYWNEDGLIFFGNNSGRDCLCIPSSMQLDLMEEIHGSLTGAVHAGFKQMYGHIANGFFWPKMTRDICQFISTCPICQKIKHAHHLLYGPLQLIPIPTQPFEVITMDFIGELPKSQGYNSIFVLICKLTKYAFFIPCTTNLTKKKAAQMLFNKIVTHVSLPKQIISDRNTQWRNLFWKEVCKSMGSRRALTTACHPQANGQTEILNQMIEVAICTFINNNCNNWLSLLLYLTFAYNNTPHTVMKFQPTYLLYRFHPHTPFNLLTKESSIGQPNKYDFHAPDAQQFAEDISTVRLATKNALRLTHLRFEDSYNNNHIFIPYKPSDKVLINIHSLQLPESKGSGTKFTRRYDGPFKVTECVSPVAYQIQLPHSYGIHPILSIAHLKPFKSDPHQEWKDLQSIQEDPEEYKVKEIMEQWKEWHHKRYQLMYKCQWKDYGITNGWIPESYLQNTKEVLDAWKLKQKELRSWE